MIVSHNVYIWFVTAMTVGLSVAWATADIIRWRRDVIRNYDEPDRRDRVFGYVIGITIGLFGCAGAVIYHLGR